MRSLYAAVNCRRPMRADGAWTSGSGRVGWPGDAPGATATGPFDLSMRELLLRPPYSISSAGRVSFHIDREGFPLPTPYQRTTNRYFLSQCVRPTWARNSAVFCQPEFLSQ